MTYPIDLADLHHCRSIAMKALKVYGDIKVDDIALIAPINQSINRSINQSINQSIDQSINQEQCDIPTVTLDYQEFRDTQSH
jgi:hypothetical protein